MANDRGFPTFDDPPRPNEAFPRPSLDEWLTAARRSLGAQPLGDLNETGSEGITVRPLYTAEDLPPDTPKIRSHHQDSWQACAIVDLRKPESALGEAVKAVDGGASALWLAVDRRSSSWTHLNAGLITGILDAARGASIYLDGRAVTPALAAVLAASAQRLGDPAKILQGGCDFDPLGTIASDGNLQWSLDGCFKVMSDMMMWSEGQAPAMRTVAVSTLPYARAGANAVQELAIALATGVEYLRRLDSCGIGPDRACRSFRLVFAVGRDLFMEICKLRAARMLWARIAQACGLPAAERGISIHAVTSPRCLTARDPWVNILRGTNEAYAAVVGNADVVTVLPFDAALGAPDELAQRLAVNTQNILREEAFLDKVRDPAGGSYFVERLTVDLAAAAWDRFQRIEASGGMVNQARSGAIARELVETLAEKSRRLAHRRELITGVSSFPYLEEDRPTRRRSQRGQRPLPDDEATAIHRAVGSTSLTFVGAVEAASEGLSVRELIDVFAGREDPEQIAALPATREAADFESLRDASDTHLQTTGARPHAFVAAVGKKSDHDCDVSSIVNLLAAGGVTAVRGEGLDGIEDTVAAYVASGSTATVLCAVDELIPDLARNIKRRGARRVLVAKRPGRHQDSWRSEGVDGYLFDGCDAVSLLTDLQQVEGVGGG